MNRRSAITVAAGLVLTMVVAGGAIALGMTGPSQADAADPAQPTSVTRPSPEARMITRTVRVERGDGAGSGTTAAGVTTASPVAVGATPSPWDDDARSDDDDRDDDSDHDADDSDDDRSDDGTHGDDHGGSDDDHGDDD